MTSVSVTPKEEDKMSSVQVEAAPIPDKVTGPVPSPAQDPPPPTQVAGYKTGLPGPPNSVKITSYRNRKEEVHVTWEPPASNAENITGYSVFLPMKTSPKSSSQKNFTVGSYWRVYSGILNSCVISFTWIDKALIDTTSQPAILLRITAKSARGYGPSVQVRWLQEGRNEPARQIMGTMKRAPSSTLPSPDPDTTAKRRCEQEGSITNEGVSNLKRKRRSRNKILISSGRYNAEELVSKYPKPPSAPPLTAAMIEEIKKALAKSPKEKIVSGFSLNILQDDLEIIANSRDWLIDVNMDFYLELIRERSKQVGYPKVFIFHSFFYTLLTDKDGGYEAVKEATGEEDIFAFDLVFVPINVNQHWILVVVNFPEKLLWCYDSMEHQNAPILKEIGTYLRKEYRRKHRSSSDVSDDGVPRKVADKSTRDYFSSKEWDVKNLSAEEIPQQTNAIDCGVFCLQYAEYLSRKKSFDFNQTHIAYFRNRMMYEILSMNLLTQMI